MAMDVRLKESVEAHLRSVGLDPVAIEEEVQELSENVTFVSIHAWGFRLRFGAEESTERTTLLAGLPSQAGGPLGRSADISSSATESSRE